MYISSSPTFRLKQLFSKSNPNKDLEVFPLNHKRLYLFFSGRYALAAGVKALGLAHDDHVLMPSYTCWVEIDPIIHEGVGRKYYRVKENFMADLDDIRKKIDDNTKAILVTHYLGFPQPLDEIIEICKRHALFLIEDCAHAFLSEYNGRALGSIGDISIFSFRKTLPIPNGGGLVINNENVTFHHRVIKPSSFSTYYVAAEFLKHQTSADNNMTKKILSMILNGTIYWSFFGLRFCLRVFHKIYRDKGLYLVYPSGNHYSKNITHWGMSPLSRQVVRSIDFEEVIRTRRRNFQFFLDNFQRQERLPLPLKGLPNGVCPLFFPIIVEQRDLLYAVLKKRGIAGHDWWRDFHPNVPWSDFPESVFLKKHLLGLPIHQDISLDHLHRIGEEFQRAYKQVLG